MKSERFAQSIEVAGREIPLLVRRNLQARRIVLRIDLVSGGVTLTLPRRTALSEGLALAQERADWIIQCIDRLPAHVPFVDGNIVPVLGSDRMIRHRPGARLGVALSGDEIVVAGAAEHLSRRLHDWLRRQARRELSVRAHEMAPRVRRRFTRIAVRDTRSRWGSCSPDGNLSFCWRLVMAPSWVIDYVVAHEVAHLVHLNHGPRFWATVDSLGVRATAARAWLDSNADRLQRIG